ncbi:NCS2 family permease [Vibrio sp. SS-MA-C1-2]|uniref:NCS2 family permease n=1 Tax=Vibrio sp. SS-MA-C1-2 TaxID=2908646 RepID=UPI001F382EE4|nr:NCS2 family permease [Vibrio sp. SS-MA-C1-2]UJF17597.1 NCS2 family permease [Vibrio sp. SS-MA-C1-2]
MLNNSVTLESKKSEENTINTGTHPLLNKLFQLDKLKTTVRTEFTAGITTFLTMMYISVVNPSLLSTTGMDFGAVFVATCLAAALGTLLTGLLANYPIALAPGMSTNAFFAFGIVGGMGYDWQTGLGVIFISGLLFLITSLLPIRSWVINGIPTNLRLAVSGGIGLFLALVALKTSGIVVASSATMVTFGDVTSPSILLAIFGFFLIAGLYAKGYKTAIVIGIITVTVISHLLGLSEIKGIVSMPPSLAPTFMQLDISAALNASVLIISLFLIDFFDTAGTTVAVTQSAKLYDENGKVPRLKRLFSCDSLATAIGAILGTSTTTSYLESTSGTAVGGRSGLTAVVVALLFLILLFFAPLAESIPASATAPAILFVSCLMISNLFKIEVDDVTEYLPAVLAAITMPFTFSIIEGFSFGFISFVFIKWFSGKQKDITLPVYFLSAIFALRWFFL